MSHADRPPKVSTRLRANLIWLGRKPFMQGRDYKLKLHTSATPVRIHKLLKVIDASEVSGQLEKDHVGRHDVADVILETRTPVAFDLISESESTGRFVIVDGYDVAGGGIITAAESDAQDDLRAEARRRDFNWVKGAVSASERAERHGHRAALGMFVGKSGSGKHRYGRALEKALFDQRRNAYMLDGSNVLLGVDQDLVWVDATQGELVRRFGEVVHLLIDSGLIVVSTTNAIGLADFGAVQALIPDAPSLALEIDPDVHSAQRCDPRIRGDEPEHEVTAAIIDPLAKRQILGR